MQYSKVVHHTTSETAEHADYFVARDLRYIRINGLSVCFEQKLSCGFAPRAIKYLT